MKNIFLLFIASITIWSCTELKSESKNTNEQKPITVVVHRGANRVAPENTITAFEKAIEQGANYIEVDLATSKDGVMYCFHDKTLDRTTNGTGLISERNSAYIDTLDAGYWFDAKFKNEGVPRVAEIIGAFRGKAKFYFDMKSVDIDQFIQFIKEKELEDECFVWFSDEKRTKILMEKAHEIPVKMNAKSAEDVQKLLSEYKPAIIETDVYNITPDMQKVCKENDLKLMANLLRDSWWEYQQAININVDMVNIDHPDYFMTMVNNPDHTFTDHRLAAHRGGIVEDHFNEFDPQSIQAAIDSGYWMLEIDVRPTADQNIVVHHDHDLKRVYGVNKKVDEMTLTELKELKAIKSGYSPMTFEEVAQMCQGKIRFMVDLKPRQLEPWFVGEVRRVLEKYNMMDNAYFIRNDVTQYFDKGKFGFRMTEAHDMKKRMDEGEDIAARYYLFDHGNRINAEVARWCQKNSIDVCASVNINHYKMEDHMAGAKRDIEHLKNCGVTFYQIDSDYDQFFELDKVNGI